MRRCGGFLSSGEGSCLAARAAGLSKLWPARRAYRERRLLLARILKRNEIVGGGASSLKSRAMAKM